MKRLSIAWVTTALLLSGVESVKAQFDVTSLPVFQGPPGARALGIGGAFIGVADDATAAEANPAGLMILTRPELSAHLRHHRMELYESGDNDSRSRPSFISYAAPWRSYVWSIYYTSAIDVGTTSSSSSLSLPFGSDIKYGGDVSLHRLGAAGAMKPVSWLAVGVAVGVSRLELKTIDTRVFPGSADRDFRSGSQSQWSSQFNGSDTGLSGNIGVLINPSGRVSFGLIYKHEAEFEISQESKARNCSNCSVNDLLKMPYPTTFSGKSDVPVPDSYGAGLSVRPFERTLVAFDYGLQRSSYQSGFHRSIWAYRAGIEYLVQANRYFVPVRAGYAVERDDASYLIRQSTRTVTVGTGIVTNNVEIALALSTGKTIVTGGRIELAILSVIRRF